MNISIFGSGYAGLGVIRRRRWTLEEAALYNAPYMEWKHKQLK